MGSYDPFEYLQHKLWPKERSGVECQFDFHPLKVRNIPKIRVCKWRPTYLWKILDVAYNFALDFTSIEVLHKKLWPSKVLGVPILGISRLPTWESWDKMTFGCSPRG